MTDQGTDEFGEILKTDVLGRVKIRPERREELFWGHYFGVIFWGQVLHRNIHHILLPLVAICEEAKV